MTSLGYHRLAGRRIDTRATGCARLIRESKLSCIIHGCASPPPRSAARRLLNRKLLEFPPDGKFIALTAFTSLRKLRVLWLRVPRRRGDARHRVRSILFLFSNSFSARDTRAQWNSGNKGSLLSWNTLIISNKAPSSFRENVIERHP